MNLPIFPKETASPCEELPIWKKILRKNFTNIDRLAKFLELDSEQSALLLKNPKFCLNIPFRLAAKMKKRTLDDPLIRQFIPLTEETSIETGFATDPVGDCRSKRTAKLLHKYNGRALILTTSACAMHCRYCFRQNYSYDVIEKTFEEELRIISNDTTIREILLSGGDPLSLSDTILESLLLKLDSIDHIRRIRFHTRFPIGIPERIDASFLTLIRKLAKQVWFVVHVNHPIELDSEVLARLKSLQQAGCTILNQAVLLKGVNDDFNVLKDLCELLADNGIVPYYLHQLDKVTGSGHFEAEETKGKMLIEELAKALPGYAVPKYVKEIAGEPCKTPVF